MAANRTTSFGVHGKGDENTDPERNEANEQKPDLEVVTNLNQGGGSWLDVPRTSSSTVRVPMVYTPRLQDSPCFPSTTETFAPMSEKWVFYATLASLLLIFCTVTSCVLALVNNNNGDSNRRRRMHQDSGLTLDYDFIVYPLTNLTMNFSDAEAWCSHTLWSEGGHLAVVKNGIEDREVTRRIQQRVQDLDCPYFLIGQRVMTSRMWISLNGRTFLPALHIPYQYDFREDSYDCFVFDLGKMAAETVSCTSKWRCAICEVEDGCGDKYLSSEGSCYTLEAFDHLLIISTLGSTPSYNSQLLHPLRTLNEFQQLCRRQHGGRLAAFHRKHVPRLVVDEIMHEIEHYRLQDVCQGKMAARGVEVAHEYETIEEEHVSYWSGSLTDPPSSHHCLAIKTQQWKRVPCERKSCFVCAHRVYHDPDRVELVDKEERQDTPSDLNPLVWG